MSSQISTLRATRYMMNVVYKYDKTFIFIKFAASLIQMVMTYPMIILPGKLIDALANVIAKKVSDPENVKSVVMIATIIICIPLLMSLFKYSVSMVLTKKQFAIMEKIEYDFYKRILLMDYETFDNPEITSIRDHAQSTLLMSIVTIDRIEQLLYAFLTIIMLTSIIVSLDIWTIIITIIVTLINSYFMSCYNKKHYKFKKDELEANRFLYAYGHTITSSLYAEEMKVYNSTDFFLNKYKQAKENIDSLRLNDSQNEQLVYLKNGVINFLQNITLYGIILNKVIVKGLSLGNYSIYLATVSRFSDSVNSLVSAWMNLSNDKLYIKDMIDFLNYPLKQYESGSLHVPADDYLIFEFRNVSFKYPNTDIYVLKNMNMTINTKEKLCIIGENGCGKTTIIKLLMRMYWVNEGEILLNGVSIYDYDYDEYLSIFSPIFQEYGIYPVSLKENIILSDKMEDSVFHKICSLLSLDKLAAKHESHYDIQIGKMIYSDGIELSGGEYQKMALARALYRDAKVFILDEPTASIDPIAEYNFYKNFANLTKNKCAIFITHRLAAIQLVDKIVVLNNGAVAESGTPKELYAKKGIYTEMFDKQSQFYRDNLS